MGPAIARLEAAAGAVRYVGPAGRRFADRAPRRGQPGRLADDDEISRGRTHASAWTAVASARSRTSARRMGTFVNGLRVSGPQTLSVGDTIEVGGTTLVVRELPIPASERSLKAVPPQPTSPPGTLVASAPPSQATPLSSFGGACDRRGAPGAPAVARPGRTADCGPDRGPSVAERPSSTLSLEAAHRLRRPHGDGRG